MLDLTLIARHSWIVAHEFHELRDAYALKPVESGTQQKIRLTDFGWTEMCYLMGRLREQADV